MAARQLGTEENYNCSTEFSDGEEASHGLRGAIPKAGFSVCRVKDGGCSVPSEPTFYITVSLKAKKPGQKGRGRGWLAARGEQGAAARGGGWALRPKPGPQPAAPVPVSSGPSEGSRHKGDCSSTPQETAT